jgi:hypothetical protein
MMPSFEAIFCVPANHSLNLVRSRARGGLFRGEYWEHEEIDTTGKLVARYESFHESGGGGAAHSGWRKYAPDGVLIEARELVPDSAA